MEQNGFENGFKESHRWPTHTGKFVEHPAERLGEEAGKWRNTNAGTPPTTTRWIP